MLSGFLLTRVGGTAELYFRPQQPVPRPPGLGPRARTCTCTLQTGWTGMSAHTKNSLKHPGKPPRGHCSPVSPACSLPRGLMRKSGEWPRWEPRHAAPGALRLNAYVWATNRQRSRGSVAVPMLMGAVLLKEAIFGPSKNPVLPRGAAKEVTVPKQSRGRAALIRPISTVTDSVSFILW